MMNADEQYVISDTEIEMMILDMPLDLVKDLVKQQLAMMQPVNYIEIIKDKIEYIKKLYGDDPDTMSKVNLLTNDIATFFISEISDHYGFTYSFDRNPEDLLDVAESIYNCFVLNYSKNIRKYLKKYITSNRKEIAENYSNKKKDVTTASIKKKVKNREMISIISNLPAVVRDLVQQPRTIEDYLESFGDYDHGIILDAFNNLELSGSMDTYFGMLLDEYEFMLYTITDDLKEKLMK